MITTLIVEMSWNLARRPKGIPERIKPRADVSRVSTVSDNLRYTCGQVTRELIAKLDGMSETSSFESIIRGFVVVAECVPIKVMCLGLYPYDNDILPPIATSLSYCPSKCSGSTPSVQVLAQIMAANAVENQEVRATRKQKKAQTETTMPNMPSVDYVARFAMMLRCSYVCARIGVAFLNVVPVHVTGIAKRVRCASYFSEWLGRIVEIHYRFGFKINIVAMGEFAADAVRKTFSTFRGSNEKVGYFGTRNPAYVVRMNVPKFVAESPIETGIMEMEMKVSQYTGTNMAAYPNESYEWKNYPAKIVSEELPKDAIRYLTSALAHHTVDDLSIAFMSMTKGLFSNIGDPSTGPSTTIKPPKVSQAEIEAMSKDNPENPDEREVVHKKAPTSVFAPKGVDPSQGSPTGQNRNSNTFPGQILMNRNSTLMELLTDAKGNVKSQTVIVVENMIRQMSEIIENEKNHEVRMEAVEERLSVVLKRSNNEDEEYIDLRDAYKDIVKAKIRDMDEALYVMKAMPAVWEGRKGLIEKEIQPSGPLMRKPDGTTLSAGMYVYMNQNASMNQNQNQGQSVNVPTTGTGSVFANRRAPSIAESHPDAASIAESQNIRTKLFSDAIDMITTTLTDQASDEVVDVMMHPLYIQNGTEISLTTQLADAIVMYMQATGTNGPNDKLGKFIEMVDPPTTEVANELADDIKTVMKDASGLVKFFDEL